MSETSQQKAITPAEVNGRFAELEAQRDAALMRAVKLAGEKAEAIDLVQILQQEVNRLSRLLTEAKTAPAEASET